MADSLEKLTAEIVECRMCPRLVAWRELVATEKRAAYRDETYWARPVPGFGDPNAELLIVGLAPAAHGGDRTGDWLFGALYRAGYANQPHSTSADDGLKLIGAYISAVVRCAPPANKPTPQERDNCQPYLQRELRLLQQVKVIVCLGKFAYDGLAKALGLKRRPPFGHGVETRLPDGRTVLCSF